MAFTTKQMREAVASLYPGTWPERVEYMKANQVQAIFVRYFKKDGSPKPKQTKTKSDEKTHNTQITVWDILNQKAGALYEENNSTDI